MTILTEDDIALAGEYVLGLLDSADEAKANARVATDTAFAREVEAWRERLQSMAAGADAPAPNHIWGEIEKSLPALSGQDTGTGPLRVWQALTAISMAVAAYFAVLNWTKDVPPQIDTAPTPTLVAALGSEKGDAAITARYDAGSGELLLTPVALRTGELYPELWVIPADGQARSLGMMATDKPTQVVVDAKMRDYMAQGATLAITPEPAGGAPGGKATGPVIASGKITLL
jgi:anti-sigma-K factor RskA